MTALRSLAKRNIYNLCETVQLGFTFDFNEKIRFRRFQDWNAFRGFIKSKRKIENAKIKITT